MLSVKNNYIDDIVNVALSQKGYHEGNSNDDLGGNNANGTNNYTEYNKNVWKKIWEI